MKLIDLHVHSTASDGTLTPSELVHYAKAKGLSAMALTDHDTVSGISSCQVTGLELGVTIIPGIEFSADFHGKELHLLGYYINPQHKVLNETLSSLVVARKQRNLDMLAKLTALGMPISLEDCLPEHSSQCTLTRAHIAHALWKKGYVTQKSEAFSRYIGDGKPAFIPKKSLTVKACTQLIHAAGGVAILAHPLLYGYGHQDLSNVLRGLILEGIDGIECFYATHHTKDTLFLLETCKRLNLLPTGGSDFHGSNKPGLDLGSGYGELTISFDLLEALQLKASTLCPY